MHAGRHAGRRRQRVHLHSACVRMLRRDAERIGFPKSFTIYDSDDQQRVIKQIYKDLMIDDKFLPVKSAIGQISSFKDKLLSAEDVAGEPFANTKAQLSPKSTRPTRAA